MIRFHCDKGSVGYLKPYAIPLAGLNEYMRFFEQDTQQLIKDFILTAFIPTKEYTQVYWRGYF